MKGLIPLLCLAACTAMQSARPGDLWAVIDDIPIPSGYKPINQPFAETNALAAGGYRSATIILQGRRMPSFALNYMHDRLPDFGWTQTDQPNTWAKGDTALSFDASNDPEGVYRISPGESVLRLTINTKR